MVAKGNTFLEGDLFPRGPAKGSTPRVRKRDGNVLFGPEKKRHRGQDASEDNRLADSTNVSQTGSSLSLSRLSVGMTVLALVTRANNAALDFALPSGLRALADPNEFLVAVSERDAGRDAVARAIERDVSDSDSDDAHSDHETDLDDEDDDDAISPLWKVLSVGQIVRAAVMDIARNHHGKKTVRVSLKPELVNLGLNPVNVLQKDFPVYAAVKSVEDHGYVLSFGTNIIHTGFLPFDNHPSSHDSDPSSPEGKMSPGQPIEVVVERDVNLPKKRKKNFSAAVHVSALKKPVHSALVDVVDGMNFQQLRAGMLLKGRVMKEGPGGVSLSAFGLFSIAVDAAHVPRASDGSWDVTVGKQTSIRLLSVDPVQKRIIGSLLPSLVHHMTPRSVPDNWRIGTIMKSLKVDNVKPGFGLILSYMAVEDDGEEEKEDSDQDEIMEDIAQADDSDLELQVPLFAHISRVSDSAGMKLESNYHRDMHVTSGARIVSIAKFDGVVNVDLRPSVLARKALTIDEIEVGALYNCKIISHAPSGSLLVAVDGDPHMNGLVPTTHISDVPIPKKRLSKHPSLSIGATVRCRALSINTGRSRVILSAKKSLVSPKFPLITSFEQAEKTLTSKPASDGNNGPMFSGSVCFVTSKGNVLVEFCGKIVGLVPATELCIDLEDSDPESSRSEIEEMYPAGQTVNVRLLKVDSRHRRMVLSLRLPSAPKQSRSEKPFQLGAILRGKLTAVDTSSKHFVVAVSTKASSAGKDAAKEDSDMDDGDASEDDEGDIVECQLPFGHLSDVTGMSERLTSELIEKTEDDSIDSDDMPISDAMVLAFRDNMPILTLKRSLINAAASEILPKSFEDVVAKGKECGSDPLILRGYVKALLPKGVIIGFLGSCVGFVSISRIADHFVGDPARVLKMNQSVSTKVQSIDGENRRFTLSMQLSDVGSSGIIDDSRSLFKSFSGLPMNLGSLKVEGEFPIGAVVDATINAEHAYGVVYKLKSDGATGVGVVLDVKESNPDIVLAEPEVQTRKIELSKKAKRSSRKQKEKVRVLDVDPITGVIDVSRDEKVISGGAKRSTLVAGQKYQATVLLAKSSYIILAVARSEKRSAVAFALRPMVSDHLLIGPGTSMQCVVVEKSPSTNRNIVTIDWEAYGKQKRERPVRKFPGSFSYSETISLIQSCGIEEEKTIIGRTVVAKVHKSFPLDVFVGVAPGVVGQIHITNTASLSADELGSSSLGVLPEEYASRFKLPVPGSSVEPAYVVGLRRASSPEIDLTKLELSVIEQGKKTRKVVEQERVVGFVRKLSSRFSTSNSGDANSQVEGSEKIYKRTLISIGPSSTVDCEDIDSLPVDGSPKLTVGSPVVCLISRIAENDANRVYGVISNNGFDSSDWFDGIVQDVNPGFGLRVLIPWLARSPDAKSKSWGNVDICDIDDDFDVAEKTISSAKVGDVVRVRHVSKRSEGESDTATTTLALTMRKQDNAGAKDSLIETGNVTSLVQGLPLRGFVRTISKKGCFVAIGRGVVAKIMLCDLSDDFVVNPDKAFPVGKVVQGKVEKVESTETDTRVTMVLRTRPRKGLKGAAADLKEGDLVRGVVKRIERYGALVKLPQGMSALLHISQADQDRDIDNPLKEWKIGQSLHSVVIKVKDKKVCVGTKRCYFEAAGIADEKITQLLEQNQKMEGPSMLDDIAQEEAVVTDDDQQAPHQTVTIDEGSDAEEEKEDVDEKIVQDVEMESLGAAKESVKAAPPLKISQAFQFSEQPVKEDVESESEKEEEDGDEVNEDKTQKKSRDKREKKRLKEAAETEIRLREESLANNPDSPETAEDFERILVGEPNSSVVWIRYMAFCLSISQVEKARAVAERALQSINLANETDRTNVWIAYINMEAQYGASNSVEVSEGDALGVRRDAAVFRVFDRACERVTDVKNFHLQTASALRATNERLADEVMRRVVRKFKTSKKVWIASGQAQFMSGNKSAAQRTLERAIMSLEKRKHVAVISKFAQFEYKYGSVERGRTVFESLVGNFPKRLDLWNIYVDMETVQCRKAEDGQSEAIRKTRELLQRCTTLDQSSKKMKFVFKKWLSFEKEFGSKEDQQEVKKLAREYVEKNTSAA